eukprot:1327384-Rhodomonas_salina.1
MEAASASDMDLGAPEHEISQESKRSRHESGRGDLTMQEAQQMTYASASPPGNLTGEQSRAPSRIGAAPGSHMAEERAAAAAGGESADLAMDDASTAQLARAKAFHQLYTTGKLKFEYAWQELQPFVGVVQHLQEHLQDGCDNHYDAYLRLSKLNNGHCEQQAIKAAEELGWQPYQNKSRELDVLIKSEFWLTRLNTFEPNVASLTLLSNLLSFFEQVGTGLVPSMAGAHGAELDEFEREARVHACWTIVKQIQVIDEYSKLSMRKWLLEQKQAEWTPDGLFIESCQWTPVEVPTDEWGREASDFMEEQDELCVLIQLAQRTEEHDASLEEQLISHL